MIAALFTCLTVGGGLMLVGFHIGRAYARQETQAAVYVMPPPSRLRHPSNHHRPASARRSTHASKRKSTTLRLVRPVYDFEANEPEPA